MRAGGRQTLINDPDYLGTREPRLTGVEYYDMVRPRLHPAPTYPADIPTNIPRQHPPSRSPPTQHQPIPRHESRNIPANIPRPDPPRTPHARAHPSPRSKADTRCDTPPPRRTRPPRLSPAPRPRPRAAPPSAHGGAA